MKSSDVELLEPIDHIDSCLHSCIGRGLVSIRLDLHATSDTDKGFTSSQVGNVNKGIVPGGKDMANCEYITGGILRSKSSFLLGFDFFSFLLALTLGALLLGGCLGRCFLGGFLDFSHNIN